MKTTCRKCHPRAGARPKRHHATCPLRGIGTNRRRTWRLFQRAFEALRGARTAFAWLHEETSADGRRLAEVALEGFREVVSGWPRELRWMLEHRLGGSPRAAFERLDRASPLFRLPPMLPLSVPSLLLAGAEPGSGVDRVLLRVSTGSVVHALSEGTARRPRLRVTLPSRDTKPLRFDSCAVPVPIALRTVYYQVQSFRSERCRLRVFLREGQEPTDEVAALLDPVVELFDLARVDIPGMTDKALVEWAYHHQRWFRSHIEASVWDESAVRRGWRHDKAKLDLGLTLIATAREALDAAAKPASEAP